MAQDDEQPQLGRHEPSLESQERPTLEQPYEVLPARELATLRKELEELRCQVDMQRGFADQGQLMTTSGRPVPTDGPWRPSHMADDTPKTPRHTARLTDTIRATPRPQGSATAPSQPMPTRVSEAAARVSQLGHEMDDARRTFRAASEAKNHLEQLYAEANAELTHLMAELQGAEY